MSAGFSGRERWESYKLEQNFRSSRWVTIDYDPVGVSSCPAISLHKMITVDCVIISFFDWCFHLALLKDRIEAVTIRIWPIVCGSSAVQLKWSFQEWAIDNDHWSVSSEWCVSGPPIYLLRRNYEVDWVVGFLWLMPSSASSGANEEIPNDSTAFCRIYLPITEYSYCLPGPYFRVNFISLGRPQLVRRIRYY